MRQQQQQQQQSEVQDAQAQPEASPKHVPKDKDLEDEDEEDEEDGVDNPQVRAMQQQFVHLLCLWSRRRGLPFLCAHLCAQACMLQFACVQMRMCMIVYDRNLHHGGK